MELLIVSIYLFLIAGPVIFIVYFFGFGGFEKVIVKRKMVKNNLKLNQRNEVEMEIAFNMVFHNFYEIKGRYAIWLKDEYKIFEEKVKVV